MSLAQDQPTLQGVLARAAYSTATKKHLQREIPFLLSAHPSLFPELTIAGTGASGNSASRQEALSLAGVVHVPYRNLAFNIPVRICFPDGYPEKAPLVRVEPTPDMVLRPSEYVDEKGAVLSDVLRRWMPSCSCFELVKDLIRTFERRMPVFTRVSVSSSSLSRSEKSPTPQSAHAAFSRVFQQRTKELSREVETLREERKILKESAGNIEKAKSQYLTNTERIISAGRAMRKDRESITKWLRSQSAKRTVAQSIDELLPEEGSPSHALLECLAKYAALEDAAVALAETHALGKCSAETLVRNLKQVYSAQCVEMQRRARLVG